MKRLIYALLFTAGLYQPVKAQTFTLHGVVTNTREEPLAGATVSGKGSPLQTKTDASGAFTLELRGEALLVVSYVGHRTKEVKVFATKATLLITLEESPSSLGEVVISTGYQEVAKERTTGSFEHIGHELFNRRPGTDVLSRLEGVTSSLLTDRHFAYGVIRGLSTLSSGLTSPLIIIDNFPYDGSIQNINPNDIESVTVLKDAAAASIWGAKAGNGVIVITTKKGKFSQPLRLSVQTNLAFFDKPDPFQVSAISTKDFIDVEQFLFDKGYYDNALSNTTSRPVVSPVVEILAKQRTGVLTAADATAQINAFRSLDVRCEYQKYLYKKALNRQHSFSLDGGSGVVSYLFSAGYDTNLASLAGNRYERLTLRSQTGLRPVKKLDVQIGISYITGKTTTNSIGGSVTAGSGKVIYPYAQLADASGLPLAVQKDYRSSFADSAGGGKLLDWKYRPLEEMQLADNSSLLRDMVVTTSVKYAVVKGMSAEARYQFENQRTDRRAYFAAGTYYTRNLVNLYSQLAGSTLTRNIPIGGILDLNTSNLTSHAVRGQLNFDFPINGKSEINAIAGSEIRNVNATGNSWRAYGYDDDLLTYNAVNYTTSYPKFYNLSGSSTIPGNISFSDGTDRFVSVYTNASYRYAGRYAATVSGRRDASNLFGVATNNKWKPLWSVGTLWNIHKERFYHVPFLPELNLRITKGYSGNVNNGRAAVVTLKYNSASPSSLTGLPYNVIDNVPNADLRWEKVGQTNIGIDFGFKNRNVTGSIEYYVKKSTDLISPVPVDLTITGLSTFYKNNASLSGHGVDIIINSKNIRGRLDWNSAFLFSYNKTVVTKYLDTRSTAAAYVNQGGLITPIEGKDAYNIITYKWGGLTATGGDPQGYLNGQLSRDYTAIINQGTWDDVTVHGSSLPHYFGALRNSFTYRNFSASVNVVYKFDYFFIRKSINYDALYAGWDGHGDFAARWMKPGDEAVTSVPSMVYPSNSRRDLFYSSSDVLVEKGDHIRLQDIKISYEWPGKRGGKQWLQDLEVYLYAGSLGILWQKSKSGLDPDNPDNIRSPRSLAVGTILHF